MDDSLLLGMVGMMVAIDAALAQVDEEPDAVRESKSLLWFSVIVSLFLTVMLGWTCYTKLWTKPDTPAFFMNGRDIKKEQALLSGFESKKKMRKAESKLTFEEKEEKKAEKDELKRKKKEQKASRKGRSSSQTSELEDGTAEGYEHDTVSTVRSRKNKATLPGAVDDDSEGVVLSD